MEKDGLWYGTHEGKRHHTSEAIERRAKRGREINPVRQVLRGRGLRNGPGNTLKCTFKSRRRRWRQEKGGSISRFARLGSVEIAPRWGPPLLTGSRRLADRGEIVFFRRKKLSGWLSRNSTQRREL